MSHADMLPNVPLQPRQDNASLIRFLAEEDSGLIQANRTQFGRRITLSRQRRQC